MRQRITSGYLIIYVMILTFITMSVGLSVLSVAGSQYTYTKDDVYRQNAVNGANACAYAVADELTADPGLTGTVYNNQTVFTNLNDSNGYVACHASVTNGPDSTKQATITSKMYRFSGDPHPISYQMEATLGSQGGSATNLDYLKGGVLVGNGGLTAPLLGILTTPQLNVLGSLRVSGYSSSQASIGSAAQPISTITVANIGCGNSTNWPQPCTSTQPVSSWALTSMDTLIYGKTCAPGQTANTANFKSPGLQASCSLPTQAMPGFDKQSFVASMTNTVSAQDLLGTGANGCLTKTPIIPGYPAFGYYYYGTTKHIPANTKIVGNLNQYYDGSTIITTSSNLKSLCTLVFDGNTYFTGNVYAAYQKTSSTYNNLFSMKLADNLSNDITIVMNGQLQIRNDASFLPSTNTHKIAHVISFYAPTNPSCQNNSNVPSATQRSCLNSSEAMQAVQIDSNGVPAYPAMQVWNEDAYSTVDLSGMTFYAYYSAASFTCGTLKIVALAAQALGSNCYIGALYSNVTATGTEPTFGDLIPATVPEYKVIDIRRL